MEAKHYSFQVTLAGYGETPEEAWNDAMEGLVTEDVSYNGEPYTIEEEG